MNMISPKVSIVIPVYNVEQYLKECLDSCINQTLSALEIICVNDCSTDGSLQILKDYAQKDSRIKIIDKNINEGLGVTRNIGQANATGKYIMFLDSDDYIALDACEKLYNNAEQYQSDTVYFNVKKFMVDTQNFSSKINMKKTLKKAYTAGSFCAKDKYKYLVMQTRQSCFKFYNREFLLKHNIKCSEHRICEDSLFRLDLMLANPKCSIVNEVFYFYRLRKNSLVNQGNSKCDLLFDIHNICTEKILNSELTREEKKIFIVNQIKWLLFWTNKKAYSSKLLHENRNIRKKLYKEIMSYFSFKELIDLKLPDEFWKDLTMIGYKYLSLYTDYSTGILQYKIRFLFIKISINKRG